jgi:hypothetical protein
MLHTFSAVTPICFVVSRFFFFFSQYKEATDLTQASRELVSQYNQATQYLLFHSCFCLMLSKQLHSPTAMYFVATWFGAQFHNHCFGDTTLFACADAYAEML